MNRVTFWLLLILTTSVHAEPFKIYIDADRTGHYESARAIEMGVNVALASAGYQLGNAKIEVVPLDHKGNVVRSFRNMKQFLADPNALVYFGGLHSPPLIKHRDYLNENKIPTLVPWAAGGPITRANSESNFVFRLSVDDTKVGFKLVEFAIEQGCVSPHLLLENTGWGKSNFANMTDAVQRFLNKKAKFTWFGWGTDAVDARLLFEEVKSAGSDCVLFVGNSREGATFVKAFASDSSAPPVYSHWGITGGNFVDKVTWQEREAAQLYFIQSCFNFLVDPLTEYQLDVFERAQTLYPEEFSTRAIKAPPGFVHAYDLTKILIKATDNTVWDDDIKKARLQVREKLENLEGPLDGLVKRYEQPFSEYKVTIPDAHEALNSDDLCMAQYDRNGAVNIIAR